MNNDFWEFCRQIEQEVEKWPEWKKKAVGFQLKEPIMDTSNMTLSEALAEIERLRERNAKLERVYKAALDAVNWVGDLRWQYPLVRALQNAKEATDG